MKNPPAKQETQESWVLFLVREDPLEKKMATHSSILAWEIPWTEKLSGQRTGRNRVTAHTHTHTHTLSIYLSHNLFLEEATS